jgi:hypothetical protein
LNSSGKRIARDFADKSDGQDKSGESKREEDIIFSEKAVNAAVLDGPIRDRSLQNVKAVWGTIRAGVCPEFIPVGDEVQANVSAYVRNGIGNQEEKYVVPGGGSQTNKERTWECSDRN